MKGGSGGPPCEFRRGRGAFIEVEDDGEFRGIGGVIADGGVQTEFEAIGGGATGIDAQAGVG